MQKVLRDSGLRRRLSEKGIDRAREFTWERCARETLRGPDESRAGKP